MQIPFEVDSPQKDENSKKEAPISNISIPDISQKTQDTRIWHLSRKKNRSQFHS